MKLHIVLRTCDKVSLNTDRIVAKDECVIRCLKSLVNSIKNTNNLDYDFHIIDDRSTRHTVKKILDIAEGMATFVFLADRDDNHINNKQKSRYSVKVMYDYIYSLDENDLVYIVEDDYLHYSDSIQKMVEAYDYFNNTIFSQEVGIFPQDFTELYPHPQNKFNDTYIKPCIVLPGPDRYYRTTWFTNESFLIPVKVILKYRQFFERLLDIGSNDGDWEGSTISNVWESQDVVMLMPIMKTLAIHVSKKEDIPFYNNDFETLWEQNKY
jgi:hypothetical protein